MLDNGYHPDLSKSVLEKVYPQVMQKIKFEIQGIQFHALHTRVAESRQFISLHVLVPGA